MDQCDEYIAKMNMYLDGELPANQLSALMEHLETCEGCRKRFDGLKITAFEMRQIMPEAPEMLHGSIMRYVRENSASNQRKRWAQKLVTVAACAAFLVMVGSGALSRMNGVFLFGGRNPPQANADLASDGPAPSAFTAEDPTSMPADANTNGIERGIEGETEGNSNSAPQSSLFTTAEIEYNTDLFVLPKLSTSEPACYYIVATGMGTLASIFPVESVYSSETGGESYAFITGGEDTKSDTEQILVDAGFELYSNIENMPEVDENAKFGLVVHFKK